MMSTTHTANHSGFAISFRSFVSAVARANPLNSLSAQYGDRVIQYVDGQAGITRQPPQDVLITPNLRTPDRQFLRQIHSMRVLPVNSLDVKVPNQAFSSVPIGMFEPIAQLDHIQSFIEKSVHGAMRITELEGIPIRMQLREYVDGAEAIEQRRARDGLIRTLSIEDINLAELYLRSAALSAHLNGPGDRLKAAAYYSKAAQQFFAAGCFSCAAASLAQVSASTYEHLARQEGKHLIMLRMAFNERIRAATYWRNSLVKDRPNDMFQEMQIYLGLANALMCDVDLSNEDVDWFLRIASEWHAHFGSELDKQNTDIYLLYRQLTRQDDLTPERWQHVPVVIRGALWVWMRKNWELGELASSAEILAFEAEQIGRDKATRFAGSFS